MQATESFSGMIGVQLQDQAVVESMGPIMERSREFLTPSDQMVAVTRRRMLRLLTQMEQGEGDTPNRADPATALGARSGAYLRQRREARDPTGAIAAGAKGR